MMRRHAWISVLVGTAALSAGLWARSTHEEKPLPDVRKLVLEVAAHQKELDKVRESYTYTSFQTKQDIDKAGRVKKSETEEHEDFFVNGHIIERTVKRNGQTLTGGDLEKETKRVTKLVEKAEKTPRGQPLEGPSITISRILELMDVRNERREMFRGRPTIVFDFVGRKDAKTHGVAENASKKLAGTLWIDEADRQVARMEVRFDDDFRVAGGLFAKVEKGSNFSFDQAPQEDGLWLPTGGEGLVQARVLLLKGIRQRIMERDYSYKRFRVETVERQGTGKNE
ncbi:MAG TPA: hypothetical protein VG844_08700 [Terracidiphilus sp.]|nr:hypothetical protein [Terracidiphilus sp.]